MIYKKVKTFLCFFICLGGVAKSMCMKKDYIEPIHGQIGDVLVLTKPLGTQIAVNLHEWKVCNDRKYSLLKSKNVITDEAERLSFNISSGSMIRLNKTAAILMHKYGAHGATDITGFGPKGHITNLAQNQEQMKENKAEYEFYVHTLPIIAGMNDVAAYLKKNKILDFRLLEGYSAETSGGLLIMLPAESADKFIKELEEIDGWPAYKVGQIRGKKQQSELVVFESEENMKVIEVGKDIEMKKKDAQTNDDNDDMKENEQ